MDKSFLGLAKDIGIYGIGVFLSRALGLLLTPLLARTFTPEQFGLLDVLQTGGAFCAIFLSMQIESALLRYYGEGQDNSELLSTCICYQLAVTGLFLVAVSVVVQAVELPLALGPSPGLVMAVPALSVVSGLFYGHFLVLLRAQRKSRAASLAISANTVVAISTTLVAVLVLDMGIAGVFVAKVIADTVCAMSIFVPHRHLYKASFSMPLLRKLLGFCIPLTPDGILSFVSGHSAKGFIVAYSTILELGFLSVATKVVLVLGLALSSMRQAWLPYAYSVAGEANAPEIYSKVFATYVRISLAILCCFAFLAPELILIIAGPNYLPATSITGPLAAAAVLGGLPYVFNIGLLLKEKTKYYTVALVVSTAVILLSNSILIPKYGTMGAALCATVGAIALAVSVLYFAQRVYPIPYGTKRVALFVLSAIALGLVTTSNAVSWSLPIRIIMAVALTAALIRPIVMMGLRQLLVKAQT